MKNNILMAITVTLVLGAALVNINHAVASPEDDTETVLGTYRVKPGMENELLKLMAEDWSLLRKHELVLSQPHLILRGEDEPGRTYFVEILNWKNHEAADHHRMCRPSGRRWALSLKSAVAIRPLNSLRFTWS